MSWTHELRAATSGFVHLCAHRGYSTAAPENTIPALRIARAHGATVAEIDVQLTRDGEIVLMHDDLLDRTTDGHGPVAAHDLAAIARLDAGAWMGPEFAGTRVPTLAEALAAAGELGLALLIEVKERQRTAALIERLGELLEAADAVGRVVLISFDHPSLLWARTRIAGLRTEIITHARHVDLAALARAAGADSVSVELEMFDAAAASALHAAGIAVRCSLPRPDWWAMRRGTGLDPAPMLGRALDAGLIDCLAGDDVPFLARMLRGDGGR